MKTTVEHKKVPKDWWLYHLETCGTKYRGCDPNCPKRIYEETGVWNRQGEE